MPKKVCSNCFKEFPFECDAKKSQADWKNCFYEVTSVSSCKGDAVHSKPGSESRGCYDITEVPTDAEIIAAKEAETAKIAREISGIAMYRSADLHVKSRTYFHIVIRVQII